jgi:hypothetical protein
MFFLAPGFPGSVQVFIASPPRLSGLHITYKLLIYFNPLAHALGVPGVVEPSSIQVHKGFESVRCLT